MMDHSESNDATFLSLLSSQRLLLRQINQQKAPSVPQRFSALSCVNTSNFLTEDPLFSSRNSPPLTEKIDGSTTISLKRRSSFDLDNDIGMDLGVSTFTQGRASTAFVSSARDERLGKQWVSEDKFVPRRNFDDLSCSPLVDCMDKPAKPSIGSKHSRQDHGLLACKLDDSVERLRNATLSLSKAMLDSTESQKAIHNWDKKMGLKRSHSKTMRLSMRSRKKLRPVLRKQLNVLSTSKMRSKVGNVQKLIM